MLTALREMPAPQVMPQRQPPRSSAENKKSSHPPITKRKSYPTPASIVSDPKLGPLPKGWTIADTEGVEPEGVDMAACFAQYCAMCEKQISTPNSSVLYCSEACRRKDSAKPLSASIIYSSTLPPCTSPTMDSPPKQILLPRTPTGVDSSSRRLSASPPCASIPPENHGFKSDLDPTEWKPKGSRTYTARAAGGRKDSEAYRFLSQFHNSINHNKSKDDDIHGIKIEVSSVDTSCNTPSLGNSPTTVNTTSSSWAMSMPTSHSVGTQSAYGTVGYDVNQRPLVTRHNRWYSTSHMTSGIGIDLVTPHIPPPADMYEKKTVAKGGNMHSGLGSFFGQTEE